MVLSIRCCQYEKSWMKSFIFFIIYCYPFRDWLFDKGITLRCQRFQYVFLSLRERKTFLKDKKNYP